MKLAGIIKAGRWLAGTLLLGGLAAQAQAQTFCVYDPLGAGGDYYSMFQDYQIAAKRWGVNIELKPYVDDDRLNDAFKAGQCDMASMIGMRARQYNMFTGTIDSPSTIENYVQMREVMNLVASPKLAKPMVEGPYEVVGVTPVGAAYPIVDDRAINSFSHAGGRKVGVMAWDKTQSMIAEDFKVTPVAMGITGLGPAFNTGKVDIVVAPVVVYKALEMNKGVGTKGGIVRRPLFQFTMQLVAYKDRFPEGFGQQSREYMAGQTDHAIGIVRNLEAAVDSRVWIYAVHSELVEWDNNMRSALDHMVKQGYFDKRMLVLLKRIRCKQDTEAQECATAAAPQPVAAPAPAATPAASN